MIRSVLLVEDDQFKQRALLDFLREELGIDSVRFAQSVVSAVDEIDTGGIEAVLLDLAIPNYDDGADASQGLGGVAVFRYLQQLAPSIPVVVITQFEALNEEGRLVDVATVKENLVSEFREQFIGLVQYRPSVGDWKDQLRLLLLGR